MKDDRSIHIKNLSLKDIQSQKFHGRGTNLNPSNRFDKIEYVPDINENDELNTKPVTKFLVDTSRSVITFNNSPDLYAKASLNVYQGCEHGCSYCYARQSHEYLSLSAGLDFETNIFVKHDAPEILRRTLASKNWEPQVIMMSGNTDCYQPIERKLELTRRCLEVLHDFHNPVNIVTKNKLVTRDIDLLKKMSEYNSAAVFLSVTTLNNRLASVMEPRTSKPQLKLQAIKELSDAGIPTGIMIAPVIPGLTDQEIPGIIKQAAEAGAKYAGFIMLRLPRGVKDLFLNWLEEYFPDRRQKVINRLHELFGDKLYDSAFYFRRRGKGAYAEEIINLFNLACRKFGINSENAELSVKSFINPEKSQLGLFD